MIESIVIFVFKAALSGLSFLLTFWGTRHLSARVWPRRPYHPTEDEELQRKEPIHDLFLPMFCLMLALAVALLIALALELI
jgi:hypothetical protein